MAYVYYWSESALLLMADHALSNSYPAYGIWSAVAVVVVYFAVVSVSQRLRATADT